MVGHPQCTRPNVRIRFNRQPKPVFILQRRRQQPVQFFGALTLEVALLIGRLHRFRRQRQPLLGLARSAAA